MSLFEWFITGGAIAGYGALGAFGVLLAYAIVAAAGKDTPTPDEKPVAIRRYRERRHR